MRGPGGPEHLVLAESRQMMSALIFVAQAEGYFADQGLTVELLPVLNGRAAMDALLDSRAELALSSDVPAAATISSVSPIRILSSVQTSDRDVQIVSPVGSGITSSAALAGKRIGYTPNTNSQHFLELLLMQSGPAQQVTSVPYDSDRIMQALAQGEIDAASVWTTVRIGGSNLFPKGLDMLSVPGLYTGSWILSTRQDVVETKRGALIRFMRALLAAEWSILQNRDRAIPMVAAATGLDESLVRTHWESYGFTLRLDQALLLSLEGHLRRAGNSPGPELLGYLQGDILREVDRTRVTVLD